MKKSIKKLLRTRKKKISDILKETIDKQYISENEYKAMLPDTEAILASVYALFKVYKP